MTSPAISVIVPARNEEAYIGRALDSVAAQDLAPGCLEIVIGANACTDATVAVARAWAEAHPDLPVRLLLFLDADSRMRRDLAREILAMEARGLPAGTLRIDADSHDTLDRAFFRMLELGKRRGSKGMMFFCARTEFLALGGFDPTLHHAEDLVLQQRLAAAGVPFGHLAASGILTSPRRLRTLPFRLGMLTMLARWTLASMGVGRRWPY